MPIVTSIWLLKRKSPDDMVLSAHIVGCSITDNLSAVSDMVTTIPFWGTGLSFLSPTHVRPEQHKSHSVFSLWQCQAVGNIFLTFCSAVYGMITYVRNPTE